MRFALGFVPFYIISILVGLQYGIVGVAVGVTVARTLGGGVAFVLAARLAGEPVWALLRELAAPLGAALVMGCLVFLARFLIQPFNLVGVTQLVILVAFGGAVYLGLLRTVFRSMLGDVLGVVDSFSRPLGIRLRQLLAMG